MADGRVVIDTKLDTTGIEKGIRTISTLLKTDLASRALGVLKDAVSFISDETGKLNESIRMASTLFGEYNVNIDELARNLRTLSNETQVAASELGMGLYNALSSGVPGSDSMAEALEFVRKNALAAKAGMAELDPTIRATASVMNSYGMTVADTDKILGIMMNTQNLGITTIRELSTTLAQVIPTAASFGVSFEQVGAALATMTAMGTQTAQATTGFNNMLSELGRQSQQAYKNLEEATEAAGIGRKNFQQLTEEGWSLADILKLLQDYAEENGKTLVDMFGSIEGGRAALQLTTNEGEKFVSFLESMYHTEGMVEKASETVMTETQRLGLSIANAASSIGNKFLPAWNEVAGKLADTITSLSGNRDTAGELKTALENLETATKGYRDAQEQAKTATDETTESMLRQAGEAQRQAILDFATAYGNAMKEMSSNSKDIMVAEGIISEMQDKLKELAEQAGMTVTEMDRLYASGRLTSGFVDEYEKYTNEIEYQREVISSLSGDVETLSDAYDSVVLSAVEGVRKGTLEMEDLQTASSDLARAVRRLSGAYEEGYESQAAFLDTDNFEDFAEQEISRLEQLQGQVEEGSAQWYKYAGAIAAVKAQMETLGIEPTGKSTAPASSNTSDNPSASSSSSSPQDAMDNWLKTTGDNIRLSKVFGDDFDLIQEQISATELAIRSLIEEFDLDEESQQVQFLKGVLEELKAKAQESIAPFRELGETLKNTFDAETVVGIFSDAFTALGETISGAKERIEELDETLTETRDKLAESQEELDDARARGDEDAIEKQEEIIKGYEEIIKATEAEKTSLENGSEGWKAFGRSALISLAEVLEGLGAQLAAQAVAGLFNPATIGAAALAGIASGVAFGAAIGLRAAAGSFEQGGIIPPVAGVNSYSGDNLIARVNAGELILNRAQQENLSGYLSALEAQRELAVPRGSNVVVYMSGAYIYGLNEPAVGKAIYDNIRTLQNEGVIR